MKTVFKSDDFMVDTPAAIDRKRAVLYINPNLFNPLTRFQRKFVIQHEFGHYVLNTSDEVAADAYAFDKLAGTEFRSLKQCMECLETILDHDNPFHRRRINALYERALQWDRDHGSTPAPAHVDKYVSQSERTINAITDLLVQNTTALNSSKVVDNNFKLTGHNTIIMTLLAAAVMFFFYKFLFND